jgi:iron complex transport system substrate-binding protein
VLRFIINIISYFPSGGVFVKGKDILRRVVAANVLATIFLLVSGGVSFAKESAKEIIDAWGRRVTIPSEVNHVICSGPGCLRYLVYLQGLELVVGVDDMEKSRPGFKARPYYLAHPELKNMPLFGEFRGHDNPELIVSLDPRPDVIFKTYGEMGYDPEELQAKTGIPVVVLNYGNLTYGRGYMYEALSIMGEVTGKTKRAQEVIEFFDRAIDDLDRRTADIPEAERPTCYVGGIAHKGPHGFPSTDAAYPPFSFVNARHVAGGKAGTGGTGTGLQQVTVSREKILEWDPEYIFIDLSTLSAGKEAGALYQLKNEACYQVLSAVQEGKLYGVFPFNWYTTNYGSVLANAYFVGKVLYPERFEDVDPAKMADQIYEFLVGKPVFEEMNGLFENLGFTRIDLDTVGKSN